MDPYRGRPDGDPSIIIAALGGVVLGLDRATGEVRWEHALAGAGAGEVALGFRHGVLVASDAAAVVFRIDPGTGQTLWDAATSGVGRATILVEPELIVVGKGGSVDAFAHHGRRRWSRPLPGPGPGRLALGVSGNVAQADDIGAE